MKTMTSEELAALWQQLQNLEAHIQDRGLRGPATNLKSLRRLQGVVLAEHSFIENLETSNPLYQQHRQERMKIK